MADSNYNEKEDALRKMRKSRNIMMTTGIGVILFCGWDLISAFLTLATQGDEYKDEILAETNEPALVWAVVAIAAFVVLVDVVVRMHLGRSIMREARTGKRSRTAILISATLAAVELYMMLLDATQPPSYYDISDIVVHMIVGFTSVSVQVELIISTLTYRKLVRSMGKDITNAA